VSTVAHVCRKKLKKNPPNISVIFLYFLTVLARGGGGARVEWGRVRAPSQRFLRAFWRSRAIRRGGGGHCTPTPSPQAAITIEHPSRALPSYIALKVQPSGSYARFGRKTGDPTRGRGGRHITPSPQAAITNDRPLRALQHVKNVYSFRSPMLASSPRTRPPPHARQPSPAHVSLPRDIKVFI
jgi:hypothetical protein